MRRRALAMVLKALVAAVALLGVPLAVLFPAHAWLSAQASLTREAASVATLIDDVADDTHSVSSAVRPRLERQAVTYSVRVSREGELLYAAGPDVGHVTQRASVETGRGITVMLEQSAWPTIRSMALAAGIVVLLCAAAFGVGTLFALRGSRRIAAPLIYLSAQAEQLGAGRVQVRRNPSGIEEIDLVQEELARSSERMAARIAAERQLASDIAHQLRTPLTAMSMRLDEIAYLAPNDEIRGEVEECLAQIERMTQSMEDLRRNAQRKNPTVGALHTDDVFAEQEREWAPKFRETDRQLCFINDAADRLPMATHGSLSQALATLIENSLRYGAGAVTVRARPGTSGRSIFFDVTDEGEGVDDEIAPDIFRRGVSGHGSTGIGLALANDLIETDGGRLTLTQRRPPIFTISLAALPASMDPDRVIPKGAVVAIGRRGRRL